MTSPPPGGADKRVFSLWPGTAAPERADSGGLPEWAVGSERPVRSSFRPRPADYALWATGGVGVGEGCHGVHASIVVGRPGAGARDGRCVPRAYPGGSQDRPRGERAVGRPEAFYRLYERRLTRGLDPERLPRHIGVLVDGNRRWARAFGASTQQGHQAGAERILDFIGWCDEAGIPVVTLYMLSTENLRRPAEELAPLLEIIQTTAERLAQPAEGRAPVCVQPVGAVDLLPEPMARRLAEVAEQTKDHDGVHVNVAVGYGGRQEILDAVRELLRDEHALGHSAAEVAESVTVEQIADRLYTRGQPDPDLVIRTSGEQRLSGFLLWQSAYSEIFFTDTYWPAFRKIDFLRALRDYSQRSRRFGK